MSKKKHHRLGDDLSLFGVIQKDRAEISKIAAHVFAAQKDLYRLERNQLLSGRRPLSFKNGYTIVPNELILATDLTDGEKLTYINLLRYCWRKKIAWPSESRQASERCISSRQIQRHITTLVRRGYLWVELIVYKGTRFHNRYRLNIDDPHRSL